MAGSEPEAEAVMAKATQLLRTKFNHNDLRGHQEAIISRLLVERQSALGILPPGSGKSLCYQLPALMLDLVLVISPLRSLMRDHVDILTGYGIPAGQLNYAQSSQDALAVVTALRANELKLLFISPERLRKESFRALIKGLTIDLLVIDEAHLIAQWGNDFRPDYLRIESFVRAFGIQRILCLTEIASPNVVNDLCVAFSIDQVHGVVRVPLYRPNLHLRVEVAPDNTRRTSLIAKLCQYHTGCTLIYVRSRDQANAVAKICDRPRVRAKEYHGRLSKDDQTKVQKWFNGTSEAILCTTIAFGLGIRKSNIRQVVHLHPPTSMAGDKQAYENYVLSSTPARWAVRGFVQQLCDIARRNFMGEGAILEVDGGHYADQLDTTVHALGLIADKLELNLGYIRVLTSDSLAYDFTAGTLRNLPEAITTDTSRAAEVIREMARFKRKYYIIDVTVAAKKHHIQQAALVSKLREWLAEGWLTELKGVTDRQRYQITKKLPFKKAEVEALGDKAFDLMEDAAKQEVTQIRELFDWATGPGCLTKSMSRYFGDVDSFPGDDECGKCSFCQNKRTPAILPPTVPNFSIPVFNAILNATKKWRHDAKFLARIALGVESPLITKEGLHKKPFFRGLRGCSWTEVLEKFQEAIDTGPSTSPPVFVPPPPYQPKRKDMPDPKKEKKEQREAKRRKLEEDAATQKPLEFNVVKNAEDTEKSSDEPTAADAEHQAGQGSGQ